MNSQSFPCGSSKLPPLSHTELEVLWLYDCKFTDTAISKLLFIEENEVLDIKSKLYNTFQAVDTKSLIDSATRTGFVSKF